MNCYISYTVVSEALVSSVNLDTICGLRHTCILHFMHEQCVSSDLIREIDTTSQDFKKNVHTLGREDRKRKLTKISESYQKAREYSDNKVQIAVQMYEMVNKGLFYLCNMCTYKQRK